MWCPMFRTELMLAMAAMAGCMSACRLDMHDAPRFDALEKSSLWDDQRASRSPVEGTVARGRLVDERPVYFTGRNDEGAYVDELPEGFSVSAELLARGKQRYGVFCSPCHGLTGYANGMIVQRGFQAPPSFHSSRLKESPLGYYFDVITNGYGAMYAYGQSVKIDDRWAIAAYVRVLQLSQDTDEADLSESQRKALEAALHPEEQEEHHGGGL